MHKTIFKLFIGILLAFQASGPLAAKMQPIKKKGNLGVIL